MPELPEVEVLRRSLEPHLVGDSIAAVEVRERRLREPVDARRLRRGTVGRAVVAARRRGKFLLLDLEGGSTLVVHLGMSGRLVLTVPRRPQPAHEHVVFHLASGSALAFSDPRRFGLILALPTATLEADRHFRDLGVEPLGPTFSGATLAAAAQGRRGPVKPFLMDARVVVGVGNIYASETLFRAGVHPTRSVARVSAARWLRVAEATREVLTQAVAEGGTTLNDFADGLGNGGYFQVSLSVYGREGEPCLRCAAPIRQLVQAGRSTFYCPRCQR
jgi:formamidopyrimidine-DNA glycosylase